MVLTVLIERINGGKFFCNYIALYIIMINISNVVSGQTNCYAPLEIGGMLTAMTNNGLRASVISTIPLVSRVSCAASCISVSPCVYIGLDTVAKKCTLLTGGGPYRAFTYFTSIYEVESRATQYSTTDLQQEPCLSNPCQNGATCQSSRTPPTFSCTCPPAYTGPLCTTVVNTTLYGMPDDNIDVYVDKVKVISYCQLNALCSATVNLTSSLIAVELFILAIMGFLSCRLAMAAVLQRCPGDA